MGNGFRVTFIGAPGGRRVEVSAAPGQPADRHAGPAGSILQIALAAGVHIEHACGGVAACGTCHVIVRQGGDSCNQPEDAELDLLDQAPGLTPQSRLACQAIPTGTEDLVVEVPAWNRNLVSERE